MANSTGRNVFGVSATRPGSGRKWTRLYDAVAGEHISASISPTGRSGYIRVETPVLDKVLRDLARRDGHAAVSEHAVVERFKIRRGKGGTTLVDYYVSEQNRQPGETSPFKWAHDGQRNRWGEMHVGTVVFDQALDLRQLWGGRQGSYTSWPDNDRVPARGINQMIEMVRTAATKDIAPTRAPESAPPNSIASHNDSQHTLLEHAGHGKLPGVVRWKDPPPATGQAR